MHNQIYTCRRTNSSSAWSVVKYARMHLQVHCPHFHWYPGQFSRSVRKAALFTAKHLPGLGVSHQKHCTGERQTYTHTHSRRSTTYILCTCGWCMYVCMHTGCGSLTRLGPIQEQGVNTRGQYKVEGTVECCEQAVSSTHPRREHLNTSNNTFDNSICTITLLAQTAHLLQLHYPHTPDILDSLSWCSYLQGEVRDRVVSQ